MEVHIRKINISGQGYEDLKSNGDFLVDKTLNMSMLDCFFSIRYGGRSDLFDGMDICKGEKFRELIR